MAASFEEYLVLEEQAQFRNEFYCGEILAKSGAHYRHSMIISNLIHRLGSALDQTDGELHAGQLLFRTGDLAAYPDLMILRGQPKLEDGPGLSGSTVGRRGTSSIHGEPLVDIQTRQADGKITIEWITGLQSTYPFESLGTTLPMTDIYERITF